VKILAVAGADPKYWPAFSQSDFDLFVGIDRGALYLLACELPLDLAVGDFDSMSTDEKQRVFSHAERIKQCPAEKDDTDTQVALLEIFEHFPEAQVTLIGASGGRMDHLFSNLFMGLEERFRPFVKQIAIVDQQNYLQYLTPGTHTIKKIEGLDYLGYCCLTPVNNLTLAGSKYTLDNVQVPHAMNYGSNEFVVDTAQIAFSSGIVAVIQSRD
jgi:thiamine pyrophosphokinase